MSDYTLLGPAAAAHSYGSVTPDPAYSLIDRKETKNYRKDVAKGTRKPTRAFEDIKHVPGSDPMNVVKHIANSAWANGLDVTRQLTNGVHLTGLGLTNALYGTLGLLPFGESYKTWINDEHANIIKDNVRWSEDFNRSTDKLIRDIPFKKLNGANGGVQRSEDYTNNPLSSAVSTGSYWSFPVLSAAQGLANTWRGLNVFSGTTGVPQTAGTVKQAVEATKPVVQVMANTAPVQGMIYSAPNAVDTVEGLGAEIPNSVRKSAEFVREYRDMLPLGYPISILQRAIGNKHATLATYLAGHPAALDNRKINQPNVYSFIPRDLSNAWLRNKELLQAASDAAADQWGDEVGVMYQNLRKGYGPWRTVDNAIVNGPDKLNVQLPPRVKNSLSELHNKLISDVNRRVAEYPESFQNTWKTFMSLEPEARQRLILRLLPAVSRRTPINPKSQDRLIQLSDLAASDAVNYKTE